MTIQTASLDRQTFAALPARQSAPVAGSAAPAPASGDASKPASTQDPSPSADAILSSARTVQAAIQNTPLEVAYGVDKGSGLTYFKFVDPATQRTIRQVPPDEILAMAKRLRLASQPSGSPGLLLDSLG